MNKILKKKKNINERELERITPIPNIDILNSSLPNFKNKQLIIKPRHKKRLPSRNMKKRKEMRYK